MTFVSHAQNCEDVVLWRALGHIQRGFYIDAGACEPDADSVTAAFYERGWTGINIEPSPDAFQRLAGARVLDINLQVACGATDGEASFLLVDGGNGLSTLQLDAQAALEADGWSVERRTVPVRSLASICREHVHGDIHFLKIDVEGTEADVLRGADFTRWRPWVVVLEATYPNSPEPNHDGWEHLLLQHRYRFAYADGLNRFYVAEEHAALAERLAQPPGVFDRFVRAQEARARHGLAAATARADRAEAHAAGLAGIGEERAALEAALAAAEERLVILAAERDAAVQEMFETNRMAAIVTLERQSLLDQRLPPPPPPVDPSLPSAEALLSSTSWRVTAPLRAVSRLVARVTGRSGNRPRNRPANRRHDWPAHS